MGEFDGMKVLYIAHYFLPNIAAGVTTEEMIKMLLQKGHKVILVAPSTYMAADSVACHHLNGLKLKPAITAIPRHVVNQSKFVSMLIATLGYISVFIAGLRCWKRDGPFAAIIVQYHAFHFASLTSFFLSLVIKAPFIVKIHDVIPGSPTNNRLEVIYDKVLSEINRVCLARASSILSLSTEVTHLLIKNFRLEASKIVVLPNAVDLNFCVSGKQVAELRNSLKLGGKKIVLFMASAFEDRGLDVLLRALQLVRDESVVLVVVGPCNQKYRKIAKQLHLNDKVVFVGGISHKLVPVYIHMANVCVGPLISRLMWYGLIPRKALECMACGKPVIVARGAVPKDLALDKVSAILVDSANYVQVASAITLLLSDGSLSKKIGKEALRIVSERYSTEKLADKLDEILAFSSKDAL